MSDHRRSPHARPRAPRRRRRHRPGHRAQPASPHGIPPAHLPGRLRAEPAPRPHRPRLLQPRPRRRRLRRLRPRRHGRRHRRQPRHRHVLQRHALGARAVRALPAADQGDRRARSAAVARVAGGVPAMCDGITQGRAGMELSLFSRDVIAMSRRSPCPTTCSTRALMLGVCDKIVPGLVAGALAFGHLPTALVPAGPMACGLPNAEKAEVRQAYAEGEVGRDELLAGEVASLPLARHLHVLRHRELQPDAHGRHGPAPARRRVRAPGRPAARRADRRPPPAGSPRSPPATAPYGIGEVVDEKAVVNGVVALLATGGSTNHTMHLVSMAAAAGIELTWEDFDDLSRGRPAAGPDLPQRPRRREPLPRRRRHAVPGRHAARRRPAARGRADRSPAPVCAATASPGARRRRSARVCVDVAHGSGDPAVLRPAADPFAPDGGLRVLGGTLGHAVIKVSAVARRAPRDRGPGAGLHRPGRVPRRRSRGASSTATSSS